MRKYQGLVIVMLIGCIVAFAGCERVAQVVSPAMPDPEPPTEVVEPPVETMPEEEVTMEPVVETPPEPEPEMPVEPVVETPPEPEPEMPPAIEGPIVSVSPAQIASPAVGEQLQVSIQIAQAADVTGYEVTLEFDPTALQYVTSAHADYLPPGAFEVPTAVSENSVYVAAASLSDPASESSGTLATVTFEVLAAKASTLTLSEANLTDSNAKELPLTPVNGEISAP